MKDRLQTRTNARRFTVWLGNTFRQIHRFFRIIDKASVDTTPSMLAGKPYLTTPVRYPNFGLSLLFSVIKVFLISILLVMISGLGAFIGIATEYIDSKPSLDWTVIDSQAQTSFIYDKDGNLLTRFYGTQNRVLVQLKDIPQNLQNAFIAIEDVRFYKHGGVDFRRLLGAVVNNLSSDSLQGGSTLTQQLIKNTILTPEQTYKRKIQEMYLAIELEKSYSKEQILEAYLNTIYLGNADYGIKVAAKDYFGIDDLSKLNLRQCAMLAGLTKNPYRYEPRRNYYIRNTPEVTDNRTATVLQEMYENGYITSQQYADAKKMPLNILEKEPDSAKADMPYYMDFLINQVIDELLVSRKLEDNLANRNKMEMELRTKGYRIYSTVDPKVQSAVETTLYTWEKYPKMRKSSDRYTIDPSTKIKIEQPQAAAVVIDYRTGEIRGMVGGRSEPQVKRGLNRAYMSHMPNGSAIKPITVYTPALDLGNSDATVMYDYPTAIPGWSTPASYPHNFSGEGYGGITTMRRAVVKSVNTIAAEFLINKVTIPVAVQKLQKMGVNKQYIRETPAGLALGTSGLSPLELCTSYSTIANKGEYLPSIAFTKLVDVKGNVVIDMKAKQQKSASQVYNPGSCWIMMDILQDVVKSGTGKNGAISGFTTAGKTGTNSDNVGVSFAGVTGYYAATVWVGSDWYKPLVSSATGGKYAAPIFKSFMTKIHEGLSNKPIIADSPSSLGVVRRQFCALSGDLASDTCPNKIEGYVVEDNLPGYTCRIHRTIKICSVSGKLATPYCPVDDVIVKNYTVLGKGTYLSTLSSSVLKNFLHISLAADTLLDQFDIKNMKPDDPRYATYFCDRHTEGIETLKQNAYQLLADTDSLLTNYSSLLTEELSQRLKTLQSTLDSLYNGSPSESDLQAAYDALKAAYDEANLMISPPTDTPEVTLPPDETPGAFG